jgi:hypothetical protein
MVLLSVTLQLGAFTQESMADEQSVGLQLVA